MVVSLEDPNVTADRTTATWFEQSDWFGGIEDGQEDMDNINQILAKNSKNAKKTKEKKSEKAEKIQDEQMDIDQGKFYTLIFVLH